MCLGRLSANKEEDSVSQCIVLNMKTERERITIERRQLDAVQVVLCYTFVMEQSCRS